MYFTAKQKKKIRKTLSKNFRQLIVERCNQKGVEINVRQVSMILDNTMKNNDLILSVADAISELLEEQKKLQMSLSEKINF